MRCKVYALIFFLIFLMGMRFCAFAQEPLEKKITIKVENTDIKNILKTIEKVAAVKFAYSPQNIDNTRLSVNAQNQTVSDILKQILYSQHMTFEAIGDLIVLHKTYEILNILTGKVLDETGHPLPGATVTVKQSNQVTSTDANGRFTVTLTNQNPILIFSCIGYNLQEIPVNGLSVISITMVPDLKSLNEVVVVGFGTQKRIAVTGALSSVSRHEIQQTPSASIQNALIGKLPGFFSQQRSGRPGDDGAEFFVRGISTFNGSTQPLILVDDIEFSYDNFANLDPNEVQSISILKDAVTTAPYGIKGANGVILVTTRRGKAGEQRINFRSEFGLQIPTHIPQFLDAANTATLRNEAIKNDGIITGAPYVPEFTDNDIELFRNGSDPYGHPNINWYNTLFKRAAPIKKNNLDLSGGTKKVQYFVSLGYENQGGILRDIKSAADLDNNYNFDRFNFRSNLDIKATRSLSLKFDLSGNNTVTNSPRFAGVSGSAETAAFYEVYNYESLNPYIYNIYNPDGSYGYSNPNRMQPAGLVNNIIGRIAYGGYQRVYQNLLNLNISGTQKLDFITPGLQTKVLVSVTNTTSATKGLIRTNFPSFYYNPVTGIYTPRDPNIYRVDPFALTYASGHPNRQSSIQANLNYERSFNKSNVTALVLYNQNTKLSPDFILSDEQYDSYKPENFRGITSRITYNYNNKYLIEFDGSYNGTDKFAAAKRFGFFPAGSAGWVASEEGFIRDNAKFIDLLKFRGSYGVVGSDNLGTFKKFYDEKYDRGDTYSLGETDNTYASIIPSTLANTNVTWEKEYKLDIGVDFSIFNGKISGTADVFRNKRYDILSLLRTVPHYFGVTTAGLPPENLGIVSNQGYEFELTYNGKIGKDFGYSLKGNYSYAKNKILEIDEVTPKYSYQMQTGRSIGEVPEWIWDGFYSTAEAANTSVPKYIGSTTAAGGLGTTVPGFLKYRDLNGDGVISDDDKGYFGKPNLPTTVVGFNTGLNYKRLSLNILMQAALDYDVQIGYSLSTPFKGNLQAIELERWTPETAVTAAFPSLVTNFQGTYMSSGATSTFWAISGNYLRIKSVELAYLLPAKWGNKIGIKNVRIYANAYNLHTWSATYKRYGLDPEVARGGGNSDYQGVYPQSAIINLGFNITIK